jgi:hypothetical protein
LALTSTFKQKLVTTRRCLPTSVKKIVIPNSILLKCIAWDKGNGYVTCGGDDGLLKIVRLDSNQKKMYLIIDYTDILDEETVFSMLAQASALNKCFNVCSKAFTCLESIPSVRKL